MTDYTPGKAPYVAGLVTTQTHDRRFATYADALAYAQRKADRYGNAVIRDARGHIIDRFGYDGAGLSFRQHLA